MQNYKRKGENNKMLNAISKEKAASSYAFVNAIEDCIAQCLENGKGEVVKFDEKGNRTLWIDSEWCMLPEKNYTEKAVMLNFRYADTGRVAYATIISETIQKHKASGVN